MTPMNLRESLGIHTKDQLFELFTAAQHATPISTHRASMIQARVFFFSAVFAVLVPLWFLLDLWLLPSELWMELLAVRLVSGAIFVIIAWQADKDPELWRARLLLGAMLAVTPVFHLITDQVINGDELTGVARVVAEIYALLPFVMVAGLTLFPLTLSEFIAYATPMFLVAIYTAFPESAAEWPQAASTVWLMLLIIGVALFSALSQLRYMLSQVSRASYDVLTGALTRRAGIEMLDLQFRLATMNQTPLSLLYLDLDHFKMINDSVGHEAGDRVLKTAAQKMGESLRKGDAVIRWGGEEFVIVLPNADGKEAGMIADRVMHAGIGMRPDDTPVTASVGVAESSESDVRDWKSQVELGDHRMYQAKTNGRARCVGLDDELILWPDVETG